MTTVLVTGGAGFIGSNFVRYRLSRTADRVVVLDKLTYAGSLENLRDVTGRPELTFVRGDIGDAPLVAGLLRERRPSQVVNFAAETHVDRSIDSPRPFVDTNVVGTFVLLEEVRRWLREVDAATAAAFRLLHVSTDEVYGSLGADGAFREDTPYAPNSPYAASKAAADHLVRAWTRTFDLPLLTTNCSNNFGPYQFPEKLIPLMVLNAADARPLPIYGDGLNVRDWLYVEDHCEGIDLALRRGRIGESYNLGGEGERTNLEVLDAICAALERHLPARSNPKMVGRGLADYRELKTFVPDRKGHDRRYAIDASKARGELGWRPRHDLGAGIEATVRWYLEHPEWCAAVERSGRYARERLGLGDGRDPEATR